MRVLVVSLLLPAAASAAAQDWPQFRGPGGQGVSAQQGLPLEWSESRNIAWKTPIQGMGWSSPVVGGGRVWITTATGDREISLRTVAFDFESGREVVNVEVFKLRRLRAINAKNSWASPTPVLEGDRVYVHFGADGTAALTTAGDVVWKAQFPYDSQHGAGGSPILYGDLLCSAAMGAMPRSWSLSTSRPGRSDGRQGDGFRTIRRIRHRS